MSISIPASIRASSSRARTAALLTAGAMLVLSVPPALAAVDCDKIAHSMVPYQITMKVGEAELKYQVIRSDKRMTTLLIRQLDGNVTKLENQGTFPKSMTMPNGETATFEYSVPTDKPLYDQGLKELQMKLLHKSDVLLDTAVQLQFLPDEKIKVGDCTFDTKHYVQTTAKGGRESRNEIWYSPELEFGLKGVSTLKSGDQQMTKTSQAADLTTSFTPFK